MMESTSINLKAEETFESYYQSEVNFLRTIPFMYLKRYSKVSSYYNLVTYAHFNRHTSNSSVHITLLMHFQNYYYY
jgi:hypothetical protein